MLKFQVPEVEVILYSDVFSLSLLFKFDV